MRKNCVIFGAGYMGSHVDLDVFSLYYNLIAYSDNNIERVGETVNGRIVISKAELVEMCKDGKVGTIVVAIMSREGRSGVIRDLKNIMMQNDFAEVEIMDYFILRQRIVYDYLKNHHEYQDDKWEPQFTENAFNWLEDIQEEIKWHLENVAMDNGQMHHLYKKWLQNKRFICNGNPDGTDAEFEAELKENDKVLDLGCGLVTYYGNVTEKNVQIELIPVDALAFFYNLINQDYGKSLFSKDKVCHFGIFEFMASFFAENYADYIIINNALEHGIDPYKSLIECLYILKPGGKIHMRHHRAEGIFEFWQGLHKWNVDYNEAEDFIIWNKENSINVSKKLKEIAEIDLKHDEASEERMQPEVYIDITKKKRFELSDYIDAAEERRQLAQLCTELMRIYASKTMEEMHHRNPWPLR